MKLLQKSRPSTPKSMIKMTNDPNACPRCDCAVYEAEKMMSKSRLYHKSCFSCVSCDHTLDYSNCMEGPNNEIYCKTCYVKEYFTGGRNKFGDFKGKLNCANIQNFSQIITPNCSMIK